MCLCVFHMLKYFLLIRNEIFCYDILQDSRSSYDKEYTFTFMSYSRGRITSNECSRVTQIILKQ